MPPRLRFDLPVLTRPFQSASQSLVGFFSPPLPILSRGFQSHLLSSGVFPIFSVHFR